MKKNILIIGGSGFVGTNIALFLSKKNTSFFYFLLIIIILLAIVISGERSAILNFFLILGMTFFEVLNVLFLASFAVQNRIENEEYGEISYIKNNNGE